MGHLIWVAGIIGIVAFYLASKLDDHEGHC
jgi:hypothetical protein